MAISSFAMYANEPVLIFPKSEVAGNQFLVDNFTTDPALALDNFVNAALLVSFLGSSRIITPSKKQKNGGLA